VRLTPEFQMPSSNSLSVPVPADHTAC